ncbi:glycosyltransferase family 2 protein [Piromyces sp. E2]|nr:glycosyltransferase family 2 protein [Piromyces sp. E2]|eukprot:OUM70492.1 glycosyltransferase family 2 protein [Piromyces sp. E2]
MNEPRDDVFLPVSDSIENENLEDDESLLEMSNNEINDDLDNELLLPLSNNKVNNFVINNKPKGKNKIKIIFLSLVSIVLGGVAINILYKIFFPNVRIYQQESGKDLKDLKISVVMAVYNTEDLVGRAIQSVLNQTLTDFEIICVNDGSKDNSLKEMLKYVDKDPRVKILSFRKNNGQGRARNEGIKLAQGEFIGFIDSDDEMTSEFFKDLWKYRENHDVVVGRMAAGTNLNRGYKPLEFRPLLHGYCYDSIWRRSFINQYNVEFSDKRIAEDLDFRISYYDHNPRIYNATNEDSYYIYRLREGSLCHYDKSRIDRDTAQIIEYVKDLNKTEEEVNEEKKKTNQVDLPKENKEADGKSDDKKDDKPEEKKTEENKETGDKKDDKSEEKKTEEEKPDDKKDDKKEEKPDDKKDDKSEDSKKDNL